MTRRCAWCKKILEWGENITQDFALGLITDGICPKCIREHFPSYHEGTKDATSIPDEKDVE